MEWNDLVSYIALAAVGILIGYAVGSRNARQVKKRVMQQLNTQSIELLEAKTSLSQLESVAKEQTRRERLLELTMKKLQKANQDVKALQLQQVARDRNAYIELSRMRMKAVQAQDKAARVTEIARKATVHLKRLELASPVTQTIEAHEPKSYGNGAPVRVSVVDQGRLDGTAEPVAQVTNRDSARLTKLLSSNEATAAG